MLYWKLKPSSLKGKLYIPSSKSQSIRALLFALLAQGKSVIHRLLPSPDIEAMIHTCSLLGCDFVRQGSSIELVGLAGKIRGAEDIIQAGNSGLILRLIGALAGLSPLPIVITGDHSIRHIRPVTPLLEGLRQWGAEAFSTREDGGAPIVVRGPLKPGVARITGEDSQPVSGLLIASAFAEGSHVLHVKNAGEKPWVALTLDWFKRFNISYNAHNFETYTIPGKNRIDGFFYEVPGDFSSLAYPLAAAILSNSELTIENVNFNELQGDKMVISLLQKMGANLEIDRDAHRLIIKKSRGLEGTILDVNECIDATPLLAVVGCFAEGTTLIKGAAIARKKESDRLSCIAAELTKMGGRIEEHPDGLSITASPLHGSAVTSHNDHRIALSLAVAALCAKGETIITQVDCVQKSYPFFCEEMQQLGADICFSHGL